AGCSGHEDRVVVFMFRRHVADRAPQTIALIGPLAALLLQHQMLADVHFGSWSCRIAISLSTSSLFHPSKLTWERTCPNRRSVPRTDIAYRQRRTTEGDHLATVSLAVRLRSASGH